MNTIRRSLIAAAAVTAIGAAVWAPLALADDDHRDDTSDSGRESIGLTTENTLVAFSTAEPGKATEIGKVSGLVGDKKLVGIDFRVQDGRLYGVGDAGGVYTIDDESAKAIKNRQLTVDLEGKFFGVDFNPAANALRIISDTGQNLRQPFAPGLLGMPAATVADTPLTNPGGSTARGVTGAAYTNNDLSAGTATTLYDLDTKLDRLSMQNPANAGTLVPVGKLGTGIGANAGFDIYSSVDNGAATANEAFGTVEVDGDRRLVAVDLRTGEATDEGSFRHDVTDLAIEIDR